MDTYIKFDNIDFSQYHPGRLEVFYRDLGIMDVLEKAVTKEKLDPHLICGADHICANHKTVEKMKQMIIDTWKYYSIDKMSGTYKNPNKEYVRHKKASGLSKNDEDKISFNFLNWGPYENSGMPDNSIWVNCNFDKEKEQQSKIGEK